MGDATRGEPGQRLLPRRACGSTRRPSSWTRAIAASAILVEFEGVYRGASGVGERRARRAPSLRLLGLHGVDRRAPALRRGEHDQVEAKSHRGLSLVLGRRHLPRRASRRRRAGAPRARRRARHDPRRRRRRCGGRGRDRRGERVHGHHDDSGDDRDGRQHRHRRRRDVAPLTMFPGAAQTLRQRLLVAQPGSWSVDQPAPVRVPHDRGQRRWRNRPTPVDRVRHPHHRSGRRAWIAHQR